MQFYAYSVRPWYCHSVQYSMFKVFHVSFALILGLKDAPYDDIIIVHVNISWRDGQVGHAC
jgi:hypothetical protein